MNLVNNYLGGEAVLDASFMVKRANHIFYQFIGDNVIYSFPKMIHFSDVNLFYKAIGYVEEIGISYVALRILSVGKEFRWYALCLQKEQMTCEGQTEYTLFIRDAARLKQELHEWKDICVLYEQYFKLLNHYMFYYKMDTKHLKILPGDQRDALFDGDFYKWIQSKCDSEDIDAQYLNVFSELCKSVEIGQHFFQYEISMRLEKEDSQAELYIFKGKTLFRNDGQKYVLMTVSKGSSSNKKMDEVLAEELSKDVGTDLINKRAITKYAIELINSKPDYPVSLVILDLDNFKYINDTYGHMFGDDVLCRVAGILNSTVGSRGAVGRIGGDEMLIVLRNIRSESELRVILRAIRTNIEGAYKKSEYVGKMLSCSMGVASYPKDALSYKKLFKIADRCLYIAKEKGKNRYVIYESELHAKYMDQNLNGEPDGNSQDKLSMVNFMIEQCSCTYGENFDLQQVCTMIGSCFGLDSIDILKYQDEKIETRYIWEIRSDHNNNSLDLSCYKWDFLSDQNYMRQFDGNNIFVIDNMKAMDSQIYIKEMDSGECVIQASVQCVIGSKDNPRGFILFNKGKMSRKWAETDISYLCILARLIGIKTFPDGKR